MYDAPTLKLSEKTKVKVTSARVVQPYKKKPFALYEIEVEDGDNEWLLSKRYSEFRKLYQHVSNMLPSPFSLFFLHFCQQINRW